MSGPLAIILLNHNQTELTLACIDSLLADGAPPESIWVIDQASQPPAAAQIEAHAGNVQVLTMHQNLGFAGGANLGAAAALVAGAEAILFLNNDTTIERGTLAALMAALTRAADVGAVSPKVYYHGSDRVFQSVGLRLDHNSGIGWMIGTGEPDRGQFDRSADREALFGCALLVRRAAWEQTGPLWEPLFLYAEETDWCVRARRHGWRLRYVPDGVVWHHASATIGQDSPLKVYYIVRNNHYLRRRNREPGWPALRGLLYALYVNGRTWLRYTRHGQYRQARAVWLGMWDAARGRMGPARDVNLRRLPEAR
jgi:GT2 family glycosyltransferase